MRFFIFILILCVGLAVFASSSFAQISISNLTGNLSITTSEGDVYIVSSADTLPKLPPGSVVEVMSGGADFGLTSPSDLLTVVAGESVANLSSGNQISVTVENRGANTQIRVLSGDLQVSIGETILALRDGSSIKTTISEGKASVFLVEGEASIVEFGGKLKPLTAGESHELGPIFSSTAAEESLDAV